MGNWPDELTARLYQLQATLGEDTEAIARELHTTPRSVNKKLSWDRSSHGGAPKRLAKLIKGPPLTVINTGSGAPAKGPQSCRPHARFSLVASVCARTQAQARGSQRR